LLGDAPNVRLVHGDVHDIAIERIDAAYCRLMLLHQPDPARVVAHMASLLRPGGVLIAHEPSDQLMQAPASEPHVPAMTRVWELVIGAARSRGARTDFGRRGRAYLEAAGLTVEHTRAYAVHYPPEIGYEIPRVALASLRPVIEEHRLATSDELDQLDAELLQMKERADVQWTSSPLMFEWIARKRGTPKADPTKNGSAARIGKQSCLTNSPLPVSPASTKSSAAGCRCTRCIWFREIPARERRRSRSSFFSKAFVEAKRPCT
jgi:hypothetical protein